MPKNDVDNSYFIISKQLPKNVFFLILRKIPFSFLKLKLGGFVIVIADVVLKVVYVVFKLGDIILKISDVFIKIGDVVIKIGDIVIMTLM